MRAKEILKLGVITERRGTQSIQNKMTMLNQDMKEEAVREIGDYLIDLCEKKNNLSLFK